MTNPIVRPTNLTIPFAFTGGKNTIPTASQIGITPGAASLTDGFPPLTRTPVTAGGVPPAGLDMNGILYELSAHAVFAGGGQRYQFDATLAAAIGGYPIGTVLQSDDGLSEYINVLAANSTNFNSTPASIGVSWIPYAGAALRAPLILADTGAANAYTAVNKPALSALVHGTFQRISIANLNTTASTYAPDGLTAKPIYGSNLAALTGGELPVSGIATLMYVVAATVNSGNGAWIILNCTGGAITLPAGSKAVTQSANDNSTNLATTAYADAIAALKANIASPTFTGTVTGPGYTVTGSSVPANGIYLPAANTVGMSMNSTYMLKMTSTTFNWGDTSRTETFSVYRNGAVQGDNVVNIHGSVSAYVVTGAAGNVAPCALSVAANSVNNRSINMGGTIQSSGGDYSEYKYKDGDFNLLPGALVGVNVKGKLTPNWNDAIHFMIKSTDPTLVGNDVWADHLGPRPVEPLFEFPSFDREPPVRLLPLGDGATEEITTLHAELTVLYEAAFAEYSAAKKQYDEAYEEAKVVFDEVTMPAFRAALAKFEAAYEAARATVDRIAFAGQVPVNVTGAKVGDYIVPAKDAKHGIKGVPVHANDMTLQQYMRAVGLVESIDADGRARVIVKAA